MKKLLIFGLVLTAVAPALATTICADDDVVAIVLDAEINATNSKTNLLASEWATHFPYGSIYGISTCTDVAGNANETRKELQSADGTIATGGERKGKYCWCKMTHPVMSAWVFRAAMTSTDHCVDTCAGTYGCGYSLGGEFKFRTSMFGSTTQQ